jgi:hypothetical protein
MLALLTFVRADTNSVLNESRIWTFKKGGKFDGCVLNFRGTNEVLMVSASDHRQYALSISLLVDTDQQTLGKLKASLEARKNAETLESQGYIELTSKLIKNFPEKVDQKQGWMDAEFGKVSNDYLGIWLPQYEQEINLGFVIVDQNSDIFDFCFTKKYTPEADLLMGLKRGAKIRLKGKIAHMGTERSWFLVDSVELLEKPKE